uniref:Uncharacterized protein n=1 Tax=Anopheles maculatus TaxID=74869 RepID=A0A182SSH6_9DIPT
MTTQRSPTIARGVQEKFKREFRKRYPFKRDQTYNHNHESDKTSSIFTRVSSIRSTYATSSIRNKLSTNRYSASKQFKFPPPNHQFHHPPASAHLHELSFGTSRKGPVNFDGTVTTTFAQNHPISWDQKLEHHRLVEHDKLIASSIDRLDHQLACSSTVPNSEDHQLRTAEPTQLALSRTEVNDVGMGRTARQRNGTARDTISSNYSDRMALKHPHPDSGGESGDGEPKPGQRSSEERDSGGHLYCNDLEELGPYFD